jgi:hypothetical protein
MHKLKTYAAAAAFLSHIGWGQDGSAHMVQNKVDKKDSVIIVVGKVINDRLFCRPAGNWSVGNQYGSLKSAKYAFTIGQPDEEVFANDFDIAFKNLAKIQANIASTPHREHLLIGEGEQIHNIRFTANVFEERDMVRSNHEFHVPTNFKHQPINIPPVQIDNIKNVPGPVRLSDVLSTPPVDALASTPSDSMLKDSIGDDKREVSFI